MHHRIVAVQVPLEAATLPPSLYSIDYAYDVKHTNFCILMVLTSYLQFQLFPIRLPET